MRKKWLSKYKISHTHFMCGVFFASTLVLACPAVVRAEQGLEPASESEYAGYIVKVSQEAVPSTGSGIDGAWEDTDDGIRLISAEENLYHADSLSDISNSFFTDDIEYVEPDYYATLYDTDTTAVTVNDPSYTNQQWYLDAVGIDKLWDAKLEGQDIDDTVDMDGNGNPLDDSIVIAVVDSGMNYDLSDIDYSRVLTGWNVLSASADVTDDVSHGTFITSMIIAEKNNDDGIAGILQNISVLPIKAFDAETTTYSAIIDGINYAVRQRNLYDGTGGKSGANVCVINLSLGGEYTSRSLKTACDTAVKNGILVVCAAGNDAAETASYPAQYTMGVGSVGKSNQASSFTQILSVDNDASNYFNKVWVCAPGERIYSYGVTLSNSGTYLKISSGTSFACPIVAALGAVMKSADNDLTQERFMEILSETATPIDSGAGSIGSQDVKCGYGLVNYAAAYKALTGKVLEAEKSDDEENTDDETSEKETEGGSSDEQQPADPCAQGHTYAVIKKVAETCSTNGYTLKRCEVCEKELQTNFVSAFGHTYNHAQLEPTCITDGYIEKYCETCHEIAEHIELPAVGHQYTLEQVVSPTYAAEGYTLYTCTICEDVYQTEHTDKLTLKTPAIASIQNAKTGIKLSWKKVTGAAGYRIYRKTGNQWTLVKRTVSLSWTDTAAKNGTTYAYRIRAYTTGAESSYSAQKTYVRLTPVTIKSLQNTKQSIATLKYKRNAKATGYIIKYSIKGSTGSAKTIKVTSNKALSRQIKQLSKNKNYQIQIRAYKKTSAGTYYSAWTTKTIKIQR